MIRINLLAADRPTGQKKKAAAGAPGALQAYLFLGLFGGGALVACGALWWFKSARIGELDTQIGAAKKRQSELQAIKAKVDEYEAQKRQLDAKIALIERLQAEQSGPVHMLDEISQAVPDFVWLTSLDQTGSGIRIKGESNGLTSVADFITNLLHAGHSSCAEPAPPDRPSDRSRCYFAKVELASSAEQNNVFQFELSANYTNVHGKLKQAATPGAPGPAAPAGAAAKP
ncbi:MAG: PilN domain-containing protein [Acidobacteria bacterium]|nr:PilN domain-containing protein [Acidobacteriota bacterium]